MADFPHIQSAHCESGVVANMLTYNNLSMSEPMAFGLASALTFAYLPFVKLGGMPLIAYRMPPGSIIKGVERQLGVRWHRRRFRNAAEGMAALDAELERGHIVGVQASVYWLPYFPDDMRFHFNAHNLVVFGRENGNYLISDPVFESPVRCDPDSLAKARFAKGALAAKGLMYRLEHVPSAIDFEKALRKAIQRNLTIMTKAPVPVIGVRGIRYLGRSIVRLAKRSRAQKYLRLYLGHIVRMQEEIGTGGAGFRFLYASFLQEAGWKIDNEKFLLASQSLTAAGDEWRVFAREATQMCRGRSAMIPERLQEILNQCADRELDVWRMLKSY